MAPHYQFFQRRTVHVNSLLLLSSTHRRPKPRKDFRAAILILQTILNLACDFVRLFSFLRQSAFPVSTADCVCLDRQHNM
jgi:uncharacterized membrane protein YbhN (UPF0104 family)